MSGFAGAIGDIASISALAKLFRGPQWGIFDQNGSPLLVGDAVLAVDMRVEWNMPTYQIEQGGFATYNKVATPYMGRISFANGGQRDISGVGGILTSLIPGLGLIDLVSSTLGFGTLQAGRRQAFLQALDTLAAGPNIVMVATPEVTYASCSISHYEYRREAADGGASLIVLDVFVQEVRIVGGSLLTNTTLPSGEDAQPQGQVQGLTPSDAEETLGLTSVNPPANSAVGAGDLTGGGGIA